MRMLFSSVYKYKLDIGWAISSIYSVVQIGEFFHIKKTNTRIVYHKF